MKKISKPMKKTIKTYENRHGQYIKVLIVTQMARDGINVENVTQIHLVGPIWNESSMYQAQSRGIRATSHDILLNEERNKIINEEKQRLLEEKENSFKDENELINIIKSRINTKLENDYKDLSTGCIWQPEYGSWMVEAVPRDPYGGFVSDLLLVEKSMQLRRMRIHAVLKDNEIARMFDLASYAKKIGLNIDHLSPNQIEPLQIQIENLLIEGIKNIK